MPRGNHTPIPTAPTTEDLPLMVVQSPCPDGHLQPSRAGLVSLARLLRLTPLPPNLEAGDVDPACAPSTHAAHARNFSPSDGERDQQAQVEGCVSQSINGNGPGALASIPDPLLIGKTNG